jgi:MFS family permease
MDFPSKPFHVLKRGPPMPENAFLRLMQNPNRTLLREIIYYMKNKTNADGYGASLWSGEFILLFLSNFFLCLGADMLMPVLPVYMDQAGGNNFQIGIVMGCFTISAIIIRLFAVKITGYLGSRVFLMAGLLVSALAAGGYYLTTVILFLFFIRIFHGFGFGATTTLYGALVSNIIPRSRMGEGMGYFGLGIVIATAIGPFLGAIIVLKPDYQWVFLLSSGLIVISILLTKLSRAGRGNENNAKGNASRFSLSDFFEIKAVFPSILAFFVGISLSGVFTFIVLFGKEAGLEKGIGLFFLITSIAELLIRTVSGKLYDRRGHFVVLVPGASACLIGTVLLSISSNMPLFISASIFYGLGLGMVFPVLQAWSVRSVDPGRRVAATATFFNFMDGGVAIGSVILGLIAQATTFSSMYLYSGIAFVLFLALYFIYYLRSRPPVTG